MKLTMGIWRRIEKLELEIKESQKYLGEQCDKLNKVDNDIFFEVLSKKLETTIAKNNVEILKRKKELVKEAFDTDENAEELFIFLKQAIFTLLDKKAKEMPDTKGSNTNYDKMNAYQQVIHLYSVLHREYRWTRQTIDNEDIEYIYDLTIVQALGHEEKEATIDSVL